MDDTASAPRPVLLDRSTTQEMHVQIADHLRDSILTGAFRPGQKLVVDEVARSLGVSSMPVRQAMVALANEGMLTALTRRGFAVAELRRRDIEDIVTVHAFIAGVFAERSATRIGSEDLEYLRAVQDDIAATVDDGDDEQHRARVGDLNFDFHRRINKAVPARRLAWFLRAVTRYVPRHVYEAVGGWVQLAVSDHPGILQALVDRDAARARQLTEEHVRRTGQSLIDHLEARGFWEGQAPQTVDPPAGRR